jgi:PTS system nitrogen regulatory IIA component
MVQLNKQCIILELAATGKEAVLNELAEAVHDKCPRLDLQSLAGILAERELLGSTGIGNGVAIPHGKVSGLNKLLLCFGRSSAGISFDAVDNRPVHIFVMILSPRDSPGKYLQTLARVSRLLKDPVTRNKFIQAADKEAILSLFNQPTP